MAVFYSVCFLFTIDSIFLGYECFSDKAVSMVFLS